ncbi:MAG TPA: DUF72 domain-containing protein [Ktedonobacteraceae bacterium]|nr:DUF72 domain-containing protein [Ktedonobacteraceae bacterium]
MAAVWIGTSGWVYPHWNGRFYPPDLPAGEQLEYYARSFPTVEINRSFYRLPTRKQFHAWAEQVAAYPDFLFAVKASRYITHMKKLLQPEEAIGRLKQATGGLGRHLGPFLYQLPPHWRADPQRLEQFISLLPCDQLAAFEFRDPSWYQPAIFEALARILDDGGCALVIAVGGPLPTPPDLPPVGPFRYLRFHNGARGIGFTDEELTHWANRLKADAQDYTAYAYFNNDPEGYAVKDALRLRELVGPAA